MSETTPRDSEWDSPSAGASRGSSAATSASRAPAPGEARSSSACPRAILVVEDDLPARRALCRILRLRRFAVHEAGTVRDAQRALAGAFDWVLLDLMLPDGSGIDVLRRIRRERLPVKVCVISGCSAELFQEARACGADEALVKPIDAQRLLDVLAGARHAA